MATVLFTAIIAVVAYWQTCFRTITWWENSEYATAAITLGITHPPGSLLLTLLGWIITRLPLGISEIFSLNLFAGVIAAITSGLVCLLAVNLIRSIEISKELTWRKHSLLVAVAGAALGSLTFAFGETLWLYAVKFTPYVLTTLFTALILWAMWSWWQRAERQDAFRWLLLTAFLFGLDFSVHRTNMLLLPGLFFWILLRRPRTFIQIKSWLSGVVGCATGLAVHLLLIPMAARDPYLNANNPSNWSRFWEYISLKQLGGGFLINLFPRKADFWNEQVMDYVDAFTANFFAIDGRLGYLGILPAILGLTGFILLWYRNRRLAGGFTLLFLLTSALTIFYFNIPADFFRSLHRHYLPCFVIFSVWIACGAGSLILYAWNERGAPRLVLAGMVALLVIATPIRQLIYNYDKCDASDKYFTYDFATGVINSLPADAILFVGGDNDTFPLWYLQAVEGIRPDVTILNLSLLNTTWYIQQQISRDPNLPLPLTQKEIALLHPQTWQDTTIAVAVKGDPEDHRLTEDTELPDSIYLQVSPTIGKGLLLMQDQIVLRMLTENQWRRPICILTTVSRRQLSWLQPYLRLEGFTRRLVPLASPPPDKELIRRNLLERYVYRGYADPAITLDMPTKYMGYNLYMGLLTLAFAELESGDTAAAADVRDQMLELLPPERLDPPPQMQQGIKRLNAVLSGSMSSRSGSD